MKKVIISSENAPKAANFFSQAVLTTNKYTLELSGQIGLDPKTGNLVEGGVREQTERTFCNIEAILFEVGWNFENITKTRVYLTSMSDYQAMNEVYASKFQGNAPARTAVAVKELPLGALVEIECCAEGDEVIRENSRE